jgi:nucleotide-binding universal stress UspA family protein
MSDRQLFDKILVPLDGPDRSERALEVAVDLAKKFGSKITPIHVYSVTVPLALYEPGVDSLGEMEVPAIAPEVISTMSGGVHKAGAYILRNGEKTVRTEGIQVKKVLREGHIVHEIIKTAREGRFDLIVIGAKGISKIQEFLLGSVTEKIIRYSPCPVLVAK